MELNVVDGQKVPVEEFAFIVDLIKKLSGVAAAESYPHIRNILHRLYIPCPSRLVPKGTHLIRCRPHLNHEERFTLISDLSYRTDFSKISKFGRANEPGQTAFYCSDNQKLSFIETSVITKQNNPLPFETMTSGVWRVEQDLVVVNLIANNVVAGLNPVVDAMHADFEKFIENRGPDSLVVKRLLTFMSDEFIREAKGNTLTYLVSAAYANYVYNHFEPIDGIIYPSSLYPKEGMNFVLWPSAVKKLMFRQAIQSRMEKRKDLPIYDETLTIESKLNDSSSEVNIHW